MQVDGEKKQLMGLHRIRSNNMENLLFSIVQNENKTRRDLAKENHISVMTVKHIVDDLLKAGIVVERTSSDSELGRKPKVLDLAEQYGQIICMNLTSSHSIVYLIYDVREQLLERQTIEFRENYSYRENLIEAITAVQQAAQLIGKQIVGISLFVPSAYYADVDLVNYDLIAGFKDLHIKQIFHEKFGIDNILVLHDMFPAARSEYDSSAPLEDSQFYFYCGDGVGGFFIHQDIAIMGENLVAGEIGKMIIKSDLRNKTYITVEDVISISGVMKKMREHGIEQSFAVILQEYQRNNATVVAVFEEILETISQVLYNILWTCNPKRLVIDSNFKEYSAMIVRHFEAYFEAFTNRQIPIYVQVKQAEYDEYHTLRGCFQMVREAWIEELSSSRLSIDECRKKGGNGAD